MGEKSGGSVMWGPIRPETQENEDTHIGYKKLRKPREAVRGLISPSFSLFPYMFICMSTYDHDEGAKKTGGGGQILVVQASRAS